MRAMAMLLSMRLYTGKKEVGCNGVVLGGQGHIASNLLLACVEPH
jgi:hypothetical protein